MNSNHHTLGSPEKQASLKSFFKPVPVSNKIERDKNPILGIDNQGEVHVEFFKKNTIVEPDNNNGNDDDNSASMVNEEIIVFSPKVFISMFMDSPNEK